MRRAVELGAQAVHRRGPGQRSGGLGEQRGAREAARRTSRGAHGVQADQPFKVRPTLGARLWLAFGAPVALLGLVLLLTGEEAADIEENLLRVETAQERAVAAIGDMEDGAAATGEAVFRYLSSGDARQAARIQAAATSFNRARVRYGALAETQGRQAFTDRLGILYQNYYKLGETLMEARDRQASGGRDLVHEKLPAFLDLMGSLTGMLRAETEGWFEIVGSATLDSHRSVALFNRSILVAFLTCLIAAAGVFLIIRVKVALPARRLLRGMRQVAAGDLELTVPVETHGEIGATAMTFNSMVQSTRRSREALREEQERTRLILDTANDAFIAIDEKGSVEEWNRRAEIIFGWTRPEITGRLLTETIIPPKHRRAHQRALESFRSTGWGQMLNRRLELTALRRDGSEFPIELSVWPSKVGGKIRFNAILHDISGRKRAEKEAQDVNEQLRATNHELERSNKEALLLSDLSDSLHGCVTLGEACQLIAHYGRELFPTDWATLFEINNSSNSAKGIASWGETSSAEKVFAPDECWALRLGRMHVAGAGQGTTGPVCRHIEGSATKTYFCLPMMAQGESVGLLHLAIASVTGAGGDRNQDDLECKRQLAVKMAQRLGLALANFKLREVLREQSISDPLTGLFNRRYLEETLERELHRAARHKAPLSIVMLDLDGFKGFNDRFGHDAGDVVLREVGVLLRNNVRGEDAACRYGGEEFTLILPGASLAEAEKRLEEVTEKIRGLKLEHYGATLQGITVSGGIVAHPDHGTTSQDVLKAADAALYEAKRGGRDRIVVGADRVRDKGFV